MNLKKLGIFIVFITALSVHRSYYITKSLKHRMKNIREREKNTRMMAKQNVHVLRRLNVNQKATGPRNSTSLHTYDCQIPLC